MADNLLVDWLNKQPKATLRKASTSNVQTSVNNNTASNMKTVTTPTINKNTTSLNLRTAAQPTVQQPVVQQATKTPVVQNASVGAGATVQAPQQSMLIGFPQQQKAQSVEPLTRKTLYIPTAAGTAGKQNKKEETRYRTTSEALMDFQADVLKKKGKMKDSDIKRLYPEFSDQLSVMQELQKELRPIVKNGKGVDADQLSQ